MAEKGYNTLESLFGGIIRREKNSLELLAILQDITVSDTEQITLQYELDGGEVQEIPVFSIGYLISQIKRLDTNQQNMIGINSSKVSVKLADGTIRTIYTSQIPTEPNPVAGVAAPVDFIIKNNAAVEELIDPLTLIEFNLNNIVPVDTKQIYVKKLVLDLSQASEVDFFNQNYNGVNNIDYNELISEFAQQNIEYQSYEYTSGIKFRQARFSGTFDISKSRNTTETIIVDNESIEEPRLIFKLNKSTYKNNETGADVSLKTGDKLVINYTAIKKTSYEITTIDLSKNEVILKRIEGYDVPKVGINIFSIYPQSQERIVTEISISKSQYMILFFKPVEPEKHVISRNWGQGVGFYTNDLAERDTDIGLLDFFENAVVNLKEGIKNFASDKYISIKDGITPNVPEVSVDDFKVEVVNTHKNSQQTDDDLKSKFKDKLTIQSEIEKISVSVSNLKQKLATSNFKTTQEKNTIQEQIRRFQSERSSKTEQLATIINEIVTRSRETNSFKAKYRVTGLWVIPETRYRDEANKTEPQQIIGFITEYRYLRKDNTSSESEVKKFGTDQQKAVQSKWQRIVGKTKVKSEDEFGDITWTDEDLLNPDMININQLSIPITQGENVEIRIKSLSEAGFPTSPLESIWSEPVIIEFPEELVSDTEVIRNETEDDRVRALFTAELETLSLFDHLADQITVGDTYFAHDTKNIASPFKTPENKPIPADEAFVGLRNDLDALTATLAQANGEIEVIVTDELGTNLSTVSKNDTVKIFAGYYSSQVADEVIPKGEIVTKLFYIEIGNLNQADLEILSYVPGISTEALPDDSYDGYVTNREEYNNYRRFWETPVSLRSINNDAALLQHHNNQDNPFIQVPSYQSSQVKGQFIYARNRDITLSNKLYDTPSNVADEVFFPDFTGTNGTRTYVWNGAAANTGGGQVTDFSVHTDHPDLQVGSDFLAKYASVWDSDGIPSDNLDASEVLYPPFFHSAYFNEPAGNANGAIQLAYQEYIKAASPTSDNFPRKVGYNKNDKYLIGRNTCGAYLFLAPPDHAALSTNSVIFNEGIIVKNGDKFKLRIPVIFEYRMTDYDGAGSTGVGIIGGFGSGSLNNLEYTKKIGLDIVIKNQPLFSFDLEIQSIYKPNSVGETNA